MRKAAPKGDMFLLFISTVVLMQSRGDTSNQYCWSQAIDIYDSFLETVCKNTSYENSDPNRWLPAVCKDICTVQIDTSCKNEDGSVKFNLTNEMTSNVIVKEYTIGKCSNCHQLRLVLITCKTDGITCKDCTNAKSIQTGYLVLTSLLGLVFGILVSLGLWLIKTKFVKRILCVSQSSSVRKNTENIRQRSSDTEMPSKALTTELNTHKEKNTKTRDDIYNHLHETRINSDLNDSPYDHAQCLTEIQSTRGNVLEDNYTHINKLCQ
ncbi:uncharacterized protein LOC128158168 [Crassostrea angulata]|uniref:uncharacterized protein LOC128158168 n=1 Tax=Magallana angulata TaxID=2784310 RepID=UPI0022B13478|nr:uncharacterized protein LOC128158168 [Crassostrea angulata]